MLTEVEKERLELALGILSGRKDEVTPYEAGLLGVASYHTKLKTLRNRAEYVVYVLICRALTTHEKSLPPVVYEGKVSD